MSNLESWAFSEIRGPVPARHASSRSRSKPKSSVRRHVQSGASEAAAEEAERALEGEEADDLREAEEEGKAGVKTS